MYGRRRVGKTYLIRGFFADKICLEVTGARAASLKDQLANFVRVLEPRARYPLAVPASWADAFEMLKRYLADLLANGERRVVFLDELPWLASPRSGFLSALDYFWNTLEAVQLGRDRAVLARPRHCAMSSDSSTRRSSSIMSGISATQGHCENAQRPFGA